MALILLAFFIYCCYRSFKNSDWGIDGPMDFIVEVIFPGIGCTLLLLIPLIIFGLIVSHNAEWQERKTGEANIISVERSSEVSGHFVLGTGYIESNPVYYYYIGSNGNYQLHWSKATSTSISERDSSTKLIQYKEYTKNYILRFLTSDYPFVLSDEFSCGDHRDVLVVPVNSIRREFHP